MDIAHVVILGSGLSGMLTAISLANMGIKTTIIESRSINAKNFYNDIRTTALTPYSKNFLDHLGLWAELKDLATEMLDVYVVDNKAPEILHLYSSALKNWLRKTSGDSCTHVLSIRSAHSPLALRSNSPNHLSILNENEEKSALGYVVKNNDFKKVLIAKIKEQSLINLIDECEYKKVDSHFDHCVITLDNDKQITCNLLIVCDGYHSKVRSYYFSDEIDVAYQTALTFDIKHEIKHDNCAMEHFLPLGPFALLPLQNPYSSSVIWSTSAIQSSLLTSLPMAEFEYLVQRNCGKSLGKVTIDSAIAAFPLKARLAGKYFHNHIVLVADSAHIVHPLAGQGLNQGIKDIEVLTELVNVMGINEQTLQQYQKLRQDDNFIMYKITDELNNIFSSYSKNLWYLRRLGFKAIDNLKPLKNLITMYAMGDR